MTRAYLGGNIISLHEKLANLYIYFLNGDEKKLLSLFSDTPLIDTPLGGEIKGKEAFASYVAG